MAHASYQFANSKVAKPFLPDSQMITQPTFLAGSGLADVVPLPLKYDIAKLFSPEQGALLGLQAYKKTASVYTKGVNKGFAVMNQAHAAGTEAASKAQTSMSKTQNPLFSL